jgi:hypothetical protein
MSNKREMARASSAKTVVIAMVGLVQYLLSGLVVVVGSAARLLFSSVGVGAMTTVLGETARLR